jgi:hypothetical protein
MIVTVACRIITVTVTVTGTRAVRGESHESPASESEAAGTGGLSLSRTRSPAVARSPRASRRRGGRPRSAGWPGTAAASQGRGPGRAGGRDR